MVGDDVEPGKAGELAVEVAGDPQGDWAAGLQGHAGSEGEVAIDQVGARRELQAVAVVSVAQSLQDGVDSAGLTGGVRLHRNGLRGRHAAEETALQRIEAIGGGWRASSGETVVPWAEPGALVWDTVE